MTDTAKPTPGPWYFCPYPAGNGGFVYAGGPGGPSICDMSQYELPEQNGEFIAEAGTVYHETHLTPRQLVKQRDELVNALRAAQNALTRCARPTDDDLKISTRDAWILCVDAESKARAALAKHGEVV